MTDPTSPRGVAPSDGDVEARLRRTLTAVADGRPVAPRVDDLRDRVAGAVVATRDDGAETTGMIASPDVDATGWYLPRPDSGWGVTGITGTPFAPRLGSRRDVAFSTPDNASGMMAEEIQQPEGASDPLAGLEQVERGSGDAQRSYGVWRDVDGSLNLVMARRDDRVLGIQVRDVDEETVYRVADGWWESEGRRIDPVPGMVRTSDVSGRGGRGRSAHTPVTVTVRRIRDGMQLSYLLRPPGADLLPTGIHDDDLGAGRGLADEDRPRPLVDVPGAPGAAWEVGPDSSPGDTAVVSQAPDADILIGDDLSFAPPASGTPPDAGSTSDEVALRRRAHIELLAAVRPADAAAWAEAVADVDADPTLATASLGEVPTSGLGPGTTTTTLTADDPPETSSTPAVPTTTDPSIASSIASDPSLDPEARAVAEALVAFARDPSDETLDGTRLHDPTTLSVLRGEGGDVVDLIEAFVDLSPAELRRPASWALSVDGRSVSAVALIAATDGVSYVRTDTALEGCGFPGLADPGPHSVAIVPTMPGPCAGRFAIVLNGDSGSISEVNVVLPTA